MATIDQSKDYYKREAGVSSTSKYIQTKNVDANGNPVVGNISDIPDQNIIAPNLKKDTAETYDISTGGGLFASLLASLGVASLKKNKVKKTISETPPDFAKSEYGTIQVKETKGGFVEVVDNTKGNERLMKLHPAGTYNQVMPDGTIQDKIVGDKITFVDQEWNIVVGKDFIEVVSGNNKVHIKKDSQLNINGTYNTNVDKDYNSVVNGNQNIDVKTHSTEKVGSGKDIEITGNLTEKVSKDVKEDVVGNINTSIGKNKTEIIGGTLNVMVTGNIMLSSSGTINIVGKNKVNIDGGSASLSGVVTQQCICSLTGKPHPMASQTVKASI